MSNLANNTVTMNEILALIDSLPEGGSASFEYTNTWTTEVPASAFRELPIITKASFTQVTTIGESAFRGCSGLKTADFPLLTTMGMHAFYAVPELETINMPLLTSLPNYAIAASSKYLGGVFPCVTSIGNYAFQMCTAITSLDFPIATSIGTRAFNANSALKRLILRNSTMVTLVNKNALIGTPMATSLKNGYIYVPAALVDTYKADTVWSDFASQFRALEDYTVDGTTTGALDETKI